MPPRVWFFRDFTQACNIMWLLEHFRKIIPQMIVVLSCGLAHYMERMRGESG